MAKITIDDKNEFMQLWKEMDNSEKSMEDLIDRWRKEHKSLEGGDMGMAINKLNCMTEYRHQLDGVVLGFHPPRWTDRDE